MLINNAAIVSRNIENEVSIYRNLMSSIIYEKKDASPQKIADKTQRASEVARNIILIEGDNDFTDLIQASVKDIISTKPGRKLIKYLVQINAGKIVIKSGNQSEFIQQKETQPIIKIDSKDKEDYNGVYRNKKITTTKPVSAVLFHELVHFLNHSVDSKAFEGRIYQADGIIDKMTKLEEQKTIIGFDHRSNVQKKKIDIICENSFLIASDLPFRISHRFIFKLPKFEKHQLEKNPNSLDDLCHWVENELKSISIIPEDKQNDKEFIKKFTTDYPLALQSIKEELKDDADFLCEILEINCQGLFFHLPEVRYNQQFLVKAIERSSLGLFFVAPELWKNKDFVLSLNSASYIYEKVDSELKTDPEIIAKFKPETR